MILEKKIKGEIWMASQRHLGDLWDKIRKVYLSIKFFGIKFGVTNTKTLMFYLKLVIISKVASVLSTA